MRLRFGSQIGTRLGGGIFADCPAAIGTLLALGHLHPGLSGTLIALAHILKRRRIGFGLGPVGIAAIGYC
jgi:hypothetical protein